MKKIIFVLVTACVLFTGCDSDKRVTMNNINNEDVVVSISSHKFRSDLVYDADTLIVYIKAFNNFGSSYTPYLSKNGKPCKYVEGKVVEVE